MTTSIIRAGGTGVPGVQTTAGNDGALALKVGPLAATVEALNIAASGAATFVGDLTANNFAGRNKIIGGDFTTNPWQRGTSFAAIAGGAYFADRWANDQGTTAVVTASKAADAPTATQAGIFTQHSLSLAVTTADTSIAAGDVWIFRQNIEGLNSASFGFGQAGSRNVTLSFWVKGTKTGVHCASLRNSASNRSYVAEYTINSTNTWEYKAITMPVDTSGTWLYTNGVGLNVSFTLMSGTNFHASADTWTAGNFVATSNQVNALDSTSNTFKIALVQLEAGSVATTFDARSVGTELALCQRYYQIGDVHLFAGGTSGDGNSMFPVQMRATPTYTFSDNLGNVSKYNDSAGSDLTLAVNATGVTSYRIRPQTILVRAATWWEFNYTVSAEL
jgi:hypothetical protein